MNIDKVFEQINSIAMYWAMWASVYFVVMTLIVILGVYNEL